MKINYDKKGLIAIGIAFFISVVINMWINNSYSLLMIPFTIGVLIPYFLLVIIVFILNLLKKRELYIFSDWRVIILFFLFESILIYNHLKIK